MGEESNIVEHHVGQHVAETLVNDVNGPEICAGKIGIGDVH